MAAVSVTESQGNLTTNGHESTRIWLEDKLVLPDIALDLVTVFDYDRGVRCRNSAQQPPDGNWRPKVTF